MNTTYSDGHGTEHDAIFLTWEEIEEILGEPHTGDDEQDEALVAFLLQAGAPRWIEDAEGWIDETGWGLIGPTTFGSQLRDARYERGWTQQELADAAGCTQSQVADWERGAQEPRAANIRRLARALGVTTDYLLGV